MEHRRDGENPGTFLQASSWLCAASPLCLALPFLPSCKEGGTQNHLGYGVGMGVRGWLTACIFHSLVSLDARPGGTLVLLQCPACPLQWLDHHLVEGELRLRSLLQTRQV